MNIGRFINQLQAQYGVFGAIAVVAAGVILAIVAIKVTKLVIKLLCWLLVIAALTLAAWWIYARYSGHALPLSVVRWM